MEKCVLRQKTRQVKVATRLNAQPDGLLSGKLCAAC